jgi:hypothetical protein
MKNFESIVGGKHPKINSTFYSHRESRFKNPKISGSRRLKHLKIEELKELKKLKIEEVKRLKKSKIEEFKD